VWEKVAVFKSDLATALRCGNKHSQNFYAESMLKLLGARRCGEGSWREGVRAVAEFLVGLGVPPAPSTWTDAPVCRAKTAYPRQVTQLLRAMFLHPWGRSSCSRCSGRRRRGVAHHRMLSPLTAATSSRKTGTIDGVSALSGYAKAVSGKTYAFSLLSQPNSQRRAAARAEQDRIVMALVVTGEGATAGFRLLVCSRS